MAQEDTSRIWLYVLVSFYIHFVVIGLSQSFGVLFIDLIDYFGSSRAETAVVNSLLTGLQLLLGPVTGLLVRYFGSREVTIVCSIISCCACGISHFATSILYLCISYGTLLGITFCHLYLSAVVIVNQHFEKRRSLVNSLGSLGGGVGTFALPPLFQMLMSKYTWRGTVLITGGIVLNCAVFGALFCPRKSSSKDELKDKTRNGVRSTFKSALSVFKNIHYVTFVCSAMLGALAYLIPFNHIPDHARDLNIPENEATWIISAIGISGMFGRVFLGWVSDFKCVSGSVMYAVSMLVCGVALASLPHLTTFMLLLVFAVVFGTFLGAWMSLQPVVTVDIVGVEKISTAFGFLTGCEGIAIFLGSPLAGWLYDVTGSYVTSFYVAGGIFGAGGAVMLLYGVISLRLRKMKDLNVHVAQEGEQRDGVKTLL